ncbi:putative pumilio domain-containing protein [Lupinus albus]|uniref:Putative pumilio domain-containing protein n=1 Tax=Lupinus albus TaxID=3870 RepID=A0A6A4NP36_LUPAL|nr:putative pumilio domain-containing protein [Lupinus albus]
MSTNNVFSDVPYDRSDFYDISWLNQNPIQMNQISLEEAFARLSFNHMPLGFNSYGLPSRSNRYDVGAIPSQNSGYGAASSLVSQKQFQRFHSNEELLCSAEFQRRFHGSVLNELRNNTNGLNITNNVRRNQRWLQQQQQQQNLNHRSIYDFRGRIVLLAMEQGGCRVLQEIMKRLKSQEEISFIFMELINNVMELMMDPFGNYVFQKLVEICSEQQRTHIILVVTNSDFHFVNMCLDIHGTRAVQKLLEHVSTQEQRSLIMSALSPGAVALTKDTNGIHVVEHCLKHFSNEDNRVIYIYIYTSICDFLIFILANYCLMAY